MSLILEDQTPGDESLVHSTPLPQHRPLQPNSGSTTDLLKANEELKKGNASLVTTFIELDEQLDALRAENRQLNRINDKLSREVARARQRQRNSISSDVHLDLMKSQLEQELTTAHQRERSIRKRLQVAENSVARLEVERDEAKAEAAKLLSQIETLKAESRVNLELIDVIDQLNFANETCKAKVAKLEEENIELRQTLEHVHEEQEKRDATLRARLSQNGQMMRYHEAALTSYSTLNLATVPPTYNEVTNGINRSQIINPNLRDRRAESFAASKASIVEDNLADVMLTDMNNQLNELKVRYNRSETEKNWMKERINCLEATIIRESRQNVSNALGKSLMFDMIDADDVNNNCNDSTCSYGLEQNQSASYTTTSSTTSSVGIQTCLPAECSLALSKKKRKPSIAKRSFLANLCCCITCID